MAENKNARDRFSRPGLRRAAPGIAAVVSILALGVLGIWGSHWVTTARADCRVAVLMFHSVVPDSQARARYAMRASDFVAQLQELQEHGVKSIDLDELLEFIESRRNSNVEACPYEHGAVLITFDVDGASYHAETVLDPLVDMGIPALFFVPTGFIDQGRAVSSEAIRALAGSGFEFGSHTEWHRDMRHVEPAELRESLDRSIETLAGLTGQGVRAVAAPGGRYDENVIALVKTARFSSFFNSDPCVITGRRSPFEICRMEIRGDRGMRSVHSVTSPARVAVQATAWDLKRGTERILGDRVWRWIHGIRASF